MTIVDLLPIIGISPEDISDTLGNMDLTILQGEYASIQIKNVRRSYHDNDSQAVKIYPAIPWTDGTCRPAYGSLEYGAVIYLKKRMLPEGRDYIKI